MNYEILVSFILSVGVLAISPGPDNLFVLTQSVTYGRRYGLATIAGLMTGCIIHTSLVAFGVSIIIQQHPKIFISIRVVGAIYLVFLAYKVLKSQGAIAVDNKKIPKKTLVQLFRVGFLMNVLNPKVTLFFLALFPGFLFSDELSKVVQFYILGGLFILTSMVVFSTVAFLGGAISEKIKNNKEVEIWLKWLQILAFIGIAIFILV